MRMLWAYTITSHVQVKLWNPQSGMLLKTYKGHGNDVNDVTRCDAPLGHVIDIHHNNIKLNTHQGSICLEYCFDST